MLKHNEVKDSTTCPMRIIEYQIVIYGENNGNDQFIRNFFQFKARNRLIAVERGQKVTRIENSGQVG